MKGDVASDIECPLGCGWIGHPRFVTQDRGSHVYNCTPRYVRKHALYQHLVQAHPGLSVRERSLILERAMQQETEVLLYDVG